MRVFLSMDDVPPVVLITDHAALRPFATVLCGGASGEVAYVSIHIDIEQVAATRRFAAALLDACDRLEQAAAKPALERAD